jgi:hypothetical protein
MNIFSKKISDAEQSLITLQESFDSLNTQFATVTEELKLANEMSNTYKEEYERVLKEKDELEAKLETANEETAEVLKEIVDADELAALKTVEILANCSHPQVDVIDENQRIDDTKFDIEQFKKLTGKELQAFYNTHKKEIFAALKSTGE